MIKSYHDYESNKDNSNFSFRSSFISKSRFTSKNKVERAKKGREWAYHTLKLTNTAPKLSEN